jgi:CRP/FNR family transcriptional regulator, cyclic AMP receptor protein
MTVNRVNAVGRVPLFASLSKRQLRRLGRDALVYEFQPGDDLVKEGAAGETMFVILDGNARVVRRGRPLRKLGPGDFFGEVAVIDRRPRTAKVSAETPLRCLILHREEIRAAVEEDPKIAWRMLEVLAGRLRD